jgi:hypothetical protein
MNFGHHRRHVSPRNRVDQRLIQLHGIMLEENHMERREKKEK